MMTQVELRNFVPMNLDEIDTDWEFSFSEGEYFEAVCSSKDAKVTCVYTIGPSSEKTKTVAYDKYTFPYEKVLKDDKKTFVVPNDGTGIVRLARGWVSNRYAYFRRKDFQDFLDKYRIDAISKINPWNFRNSETVYIIDKPSDRLLMPEKSCVEILNGRQHISSNRKMVISTNNSISKFLVVSVKNAPFWIHEQEKNGRIVRRLYVNNEIFGNNIPALQKDLDKLLA